MRPARTGDKTGMRGIALLARIGDLALPPRCPGCGATVAAADRFCRDCWRTLRFIGPPWCAACFHPFDHDSGGEQRCDACLTDPPPHRGVAAAVAYGAVPRAVALQLKYGGRTGHASVAARLMRRLLPDDADLLVPVPLHRWRLWRRGYNQAGLIAHALSRAAGVPVDTGVLRRTRATAGLRGLSGAARRRAVEGAFAVDPGAATRLRGAHVVLVDDVYTSGATANACTEALLAAGAAGVTVLAWARVLDDHEAD